MGRKVGGKYVTATSKGKAGGRSNGVLHRGPAIAGGGDQNGGKAVAEIGIKARGVKSGCQEGGKKVVGSEGMAGVELKGNVGLKNGVRLKGRKGVDLKGVESGGQQKKE